MTLTYVYHSGFALETSRCVFIFDYYKDPAGVLPTMLSCGKPVYVFVSHFHYDHFNPQILEWRNTHLADSQRCPRIVYVFSHDILEHGCASRDDADVWMDKGDSFADDNVSVEAFGSTDSGISFLLNVDGHTVFHAGDLNNWHWSDESTKEEAAKAEQWYLDELACICRRTRHIGLAMFPVDARIGTDYMRGARQFVEQIRVDTFVPMHFTAFGFESANAFQPVAEAQGCRFLRIEHDGQSFDVLS